MHATDTRPGTEVRRLLSIALRAPDEVANLPSRDLDLLLQLVRAVRLHGRLCADLKRLDVMEQLPQVARDQLSSALVMAEARARVALWELDRIAWELREEPKLTLICMKGCAYLLADLPNTRGRIFADVDLLLPGDHLPQAEVILNGRGWITQKLSPYDDNYYRRWTHELPPLVHAERDVEIDLHHTILPVTSRLKPDPSKLVERSLEVPGMRYRILASEDLTLHAMVHLMVDSDLADKLRDLVDIDDLVEHFAGDDPEFWDRFIARARELGLTRPAYYSLRYCSLLLDSTLPQSVGESIAAWAPPAPLRWLMDKLIPRALFPAHPDYPSRVTAVCRLLLYMRSHWLRMPPWLLIYHLSYKLYVARIRREPRKPID